MRFFSVVSTHNSRVRLAIKSKWLLNSLLFQFLFLLHAYTRRVVWLYEWELLFRRVEREREEWGERACECVSELSFVYCDISQISWISPLTLSLCDIIASRHQALARYLDSTCSELSVLRRWLLRRPIVAIRVISFHISRRRWWSGRNGDFNFKFSLSCLNETNLIT